MSLALLYRLQQAINRRQSLLKRLQNLRREFQLNAMEQNLENLRNTLKSLQDSQQKIQQTLREQQLSLKSLQEKKKERERKMLSSSVVKEIQGLETSLQELQAGIEALEEEMLGEMLKMEENEKAMARLRSELNHLQNEWSQKLNQFTQEQNAIQTEIHRQEEEEKILRSQGDVKQLLEFDRLMEAKGGIAIAVVSDKTCGVCRMLIPSADLSHLKQDEQVTCQHCGRILYQES